MPTCKICRKRIKVSTTGIRSYKCRICGRTVCFDHYDVSRGLCHICAGIMPEKKPITTKAT